MNQFIKYPKIHRLGKDETLGILQHEVVLQEKVDGANVSIWIDDDGKIHTASRNREVDAGFRGFVEYVKGHSGILKLLNDHPHYRLYGEWLVRHTISYNETAYERFYLFDILDHRKVEDDGLAGAFLPMQEVVAVGDYYELDMPQVFAVGKFTPEQIEEYAGESSLGDVGEGVVIKAKNFINQFGDHSYAKVVTPQFTESNAITFGGNNKYSETYHEMYFVNKYATLSRVKKIVHKLESELGRGLDKKDTPRILNTCYHDMISEEAWDIAKHMAKKNVGLNFRQLQRLASKKFVQIYHDLLDGDISVADKKEEGNDGK